MEIRLRSNGMVITESAFREMHGNVSFPAALTGEHLDTMGADQTFDDLPPPPPEAFKDVKRGPMEYIGGRWVYTWAVRSWEQGEIDAFRAAGKLDCWSRIKAKRDSLKSGGVLVAGKWFHSDADSRIQHMALTIMGMNIPDNLQWKTMDGTFVTMTRDLVNEIFMAVATLDMAAFAAAEQHRIAMEAAGNPAAYNFSAGWPDVYGG